VALSNESKRKLSVAVVVPVRNGGRFLLRSLKSVERVAVSVKADVSVVIVDDGADLSLRDVLATGHVQLPISIQVGKQEGPSAARNLGAAMASSDYLAFLDVDDAILSPWAAMLSVCEDQLLGGQTLCAIRGSSIWISGVSGRRYDAPATWLPGCYLVSRQAFHAAGGFDKARKWGEHHDLGKRLAGIPDLEIFDCSNSGPVLVKLHDRSAAVLFSYAERRHDAAKLERRGLTGDLELARNSDVGAVCLSRLGEWPSARAEALDALEYEYSLRRWLRAKVLEIPGVRSLVFRGRFRLRDALGRGLLQAQRHVRAVTRIVSLFIALVRQPAEYVS
jgi:hypothetical protein